MRTRALILAHLGLVIGCKDKEPPAVVAEPATAAPVPSSAPVVSTATTEPTPPPPPTASAAPSSSVRPTPTISLTVTAKPQLGPNRCITADDCPGHVPCNPSGDPKEPGYCRSYAIRGRPLVVEGAPRFAPVEGATGDALERAAREEHASVGAFARTLCQLMAVGAPSWLLAETQAALADEIRHTELTLDALSRRTGVRPRLLALPEAVAPMTSAPREIFRDVFRGGVVGEALAAAEAERACDEDPERRELHEIILADEARHAALAAKTARWLVEAHGIEDARDDEIALFLASASDRERALVEPALAYITS